MVQIKTFFKIVKSLALTLGIYLGIFIGITAININMNSDEDENGYTNTKVNVAIIDHDQSALSKGLSQFLGDNAEVKKIIQTETGMEDALFQRVAEYIIIIPENYQQDLLNNKDTTLTSKEVPGAYSAVFAKNLVSQYLSTFDTYRKSLENTDINEIIKMTNESVKTSVDVKLTSKPKSTFNLAESSFRFGVYSLISCIILGVGEILAIFFRKEIADRINVSPLHNFKKNLIFILFSLVFTLFIWLINIIVDVFLLGSDMFTINGFMRSMNFLVLSLVAMAIGFIVSALVSSRNGRNGIANVVALGSSFICGVFVPLEFLNKSVVKIATFNPVYWYVKANEKINELTSFNSGEMNKVLQCMGIQMLFMIALLSIGLVIKKQRTHKLLLDK